MFTDKLGLGRPQDISARMDLIDSAGNAVYEKDKEGNELEPGWLEFWGPDAEPVRRFGRELSIEFLLEEKRNNLKAGSKKYTKQQAEREFEKWERSLVEGLAIRLKNWRLVSIDGEVQDIPCTKENAEQLFGHPEYSYLKTAAQEFVSDTENFSTKRPEPSSPSPKTSSEDSSAESDQPRPTQKSRRPSE